MNEDSTRTFGWTERGFALFISVHLTKGFILYFGISPHNHQFWPNLAFTSHFLVTSESLYLLDLSGP